MADEVVVGATRRDLTVVLIDAATGLPVDLTGAAVVVKLEGKSPDLPSKTINATMTVIAPATSGTVKYAGLGNLVSHADLAAANPPNGIVSALFKLRVHFTTQDGRTDWAPQFELNFVDNPLGT